jgi:hypothetical protein
MPSRNRHLPRGQSWPLTLTDLIEGLGEAYSLVRRPRFDTGMFSDVVLRVRWTPAESFNYGMGGIHPDAVGIEVTVKPVRSLDRVAVRSLLRSRGVPQLREWVESTQTAAETWTLARKPYDFRHAGVSLRPNAGTPATQVAEWAGHSVEILQRVYAHCLDGHDERWFDKIDAALVG